MLLEAESDVVRRGVEARAKGPGWGVFVGLPDQLRGQSEEEIAALDAARERGVFVGVMSIADLIRLVPERGHDPAVLTGIVRQLRQPPRRGEVHVLALLDNCAATVTARASAEMVAARDADEARIRRIGELLALAEPEVLRRAEEATRRTGALFVVAAPEDAVLARLGADEAAWAAARARGAYVGLHGAAEAIAALPLEGLEADDAVRAARKWATPPPAGQVRVIAVHDGHITVVTRSPAPGCLALA
jgi:hypothetical protein